MTRPLTRSLGLVLALALSAVACTALPGGSTAPGVATPAPSVAGGGTACPTAQPISEVVNIVSPGLPA